MPAQHTKSMTAVFSPPMASCYLQWIQSTYCSAQDTHSYTSSLCPLPFHYCGRSHIDPQEIGLNYKSVTRNWKKYGSWHVFSRLERVCSWVFCHLTRLEWDLHCRSLHGSAKFIISSTIYTPLCQQIKQGSQECEWSIIRHPLCWVASAKWPTSVYLASGQSISFQEQESDQAYFRHYASVPRSLSLSFAVLNPFFLVVCLSDRDYRWWWEEKISGCRPAGPSVCRQKIEFICVIQMLMLSSLFVCVAQSEERIGHWAGGGGVWWWWWGEASSHPLGSFCTCIKENVHGLMTAYSV